jgi:hypothetical protein
MNKAGIGALTVGELKGIINDLPDDTSVVLEFSAYTLLPVYSIEYTNKILEFGVHDHWAQQAWIKLLFRYVKNKDN